MIILPYKVKNPPKHFPVVTFAIILINIFVYALTTEKLLVIREDILQNYALLWGYSGPVTIFTALFLHAGLTHLIGNMLFLAIFGPAVEDRVGIPIYLGLYFFAGIAGHVAESLLGAAAASGAAIPTIGASGCIMGVLGAYWYLFSWSPVCVFYSFGFWFWGVKDVAAIWVIGAYFLMDLFQGFFTRTMGVVGGVANFAHVGGAVMGAAIVWGLQFKRDSNQVSQVKAAQADLGGLEALSGDDLKQLLVNCPGDEELLRKYVENAVDIQDRDAICFALSINPKLILTECPWAIAHYLLTMEGDHSIFSAGELIYVARFLEDRSRPDEAMRVYSIIEQHYADAPELEMALYRMAAIYWHKRVDARNAISKLKTQLDKFPYGPLSFNSDDLLTEIRKSVDEGSAEAA